MQITCLCENTPYSDEFYAEHGLSLHIETKQHKILFDMGQSDVFLKNAKILGIDLSGVDIAILSHGHYDHGGGLKEFLKINNKARVYVSQQVFGKFYNGCEKYIGLDEALKKSERLVFVSNYLEIDRGLQLFSCNEKNLKYPIDSAGLNELTGDEFYPDKFAHEQYLKITEDNKEYLISGCSHKGILNIAEWFDADVLVGGFHLKDYEPKENNPCLMKISEELQQKDTIYYTCHCTGVEQYEILKKKMKNKLKYLSAGQKINM